MTKEIRTREKPFVSICIPTYNRADSYLKDTLASALEQTYPNIEVIVSDNCSTDATAYLVNGFKNERLKYIRHKKNIGANNNFNFCLKIAKGDYFLLLHSDDLIDKDFVQSCMAHVDYRKDVGFIQTGARVIDTDDNILYQCENRTAGLPAGQFFLAWFNNRTCWYFCNTLYNTRLLRKAGGLQSNKHLVQDNVAIVKLASRYERGDVEKVKASFRKHKDQITFSAKIKDWCDDYLTLIDLMCSVVDGDQALIRDEGMRVLCKRNLNRASAIKSPMKRLLTYYTVCRKYKFKYSLMAYLYQNEILYILRKIKSKPFLYRSNKNTQNTTTL
jgi:glycosyltransferase involved in cell wall biosynthesis